MRAFRNDRFSANAGNAAGKIDATAATGATGVRRACRSALSPAHIFALAIAFALCVFVAFAVALGATEATKAYGQNGFGAQTQNIIDAFKLQARHLAEAGVSAPVDSDNQQVGNDVEQAQGIPSDAINSTGGAANAFPRTFDLRNCDLDGNGQFKNYVTSVKFQNPWGTCWAFAGIAASETSILSELRQSSVVTDAQGNLRDAIDLSEHHLAWFNYTPITAAEVPSQAGEGSYSVAEEQATGEFAQSQRLNTGGTSLSNTSQFAMGTGVVEEPDASDPSLSAAQIQLLYRGKNGTTSTTSRGSVCYSVEDVWAIDNAQRFKQSYVLEEGICLPGAAAFDEAGNYSIEHAQRITALMKEQLLQGRALAVSFCADNYNPSKTDKVAKFINTDTWAHYTYMKTNANHEVTVVGWDDDYPAQNFLSQVQKTDESGAPVFNPDGTPVMIDVEQPPANGAWIVKNSWGATESIGQGLNINPWGLDGTGYFYLSYYDKSLTGEEAFDFDLETPADERTSITNQYDLMTSEMARSISSAEAVTTANVFTAQESQAVSALGVMTGEENETANYRIYRLASASQRIDEGELLCDFTLRHEHAGYHRIELESPCIMKKGEAFAVAVTQHGDNGYLMGVAYDYNRKGYDAGLPGDRYYALGVVNPGESYLYTAQDDTWTDWSVVKAELESSEGESSYFTYDNFPIKAFAVPVSADLDDAVVTVSPESFTYDGAEHAPQLTVTMDGTVLTEGVDYVLSGDTARTEPGTYTIAISGTGDRYVGEKAVSWSIVAGGSSGGDVPAGGSSAGNAPSTGDGAGVLTGLFALVLAVAAAGSLAAGRRLRRMR